MSDVQYSFVRKEMQPAMPAPTSTTGVVGWIKQNLFPNWISSVLTLFCLYLLYLVVPPLFNFAFTDAIWEGVNREDCLAKDGGHVGACWPYVAAKMQQFVYGQYPGSELWRVNLVYFMLFAGIIPMAMPSVPFKQLNIIFLLVIFPIASVILLTGGLFGYPLFGLEWVETRLWGGILVTLVVAVSGIVASLPIGILLALGRRSKMPAVKLFCIIFIEFWRGVPLIIVLFMSSVMLPLFLPDGVSFDKLLRALIGVALFSAAYMAEVIRGGLQAIPKGQYEGAASLGLGYWQSMRLIILPQALKLVIPGIVNTFIGLFKDTTLVLIIGLFDLLGMIQQTFTDPNWSTPTQSHTAYLFASVFYFVFCFGMSRYSIFMEHRLSAGDRR